MELVLDSNSTYDKVISCARSALKQSEDEEFVITTPAGIVVAGFSDQNWTIGEYKQIKRPSGQLSIALCNKVGTFVGKTERSVQR